MDKAMYQGNMEFIKYAIRRLESINDIYESILNDSSEAKKQVERTIKTIKTPTPDVVVTSSLLIWAGMTELAKRYIGGEQSFLVLNQSKPKELSNAIEKTQKESDHLYAKYCLISRTT